MALTPEQTQAILRAKAQGLTKEQAIAQAFSKTPQRPGAAPGRFADAGQDVVETGKGVYNSLRQRVLDTQSVVANPTPGGIATVGGNIPGAVGDIVGGLVTGAAKVGMRQSEEDAVAAKVGSAVNATGVPEAISNTTPETQRNLRAGSGFLDLIGLGVAGKAKSMLTRTPDVKAPGIATPDAPAPRLTDEQVVQTAQQTLQKQADAALDPRAKEEAARAAMSFGERYIGLEPDVKARLQEMGPQKLQEYLDAVHLRNVDDTAPTPYEIGSRNVENAETKLNTVLNDTGSGIGQTRAKLATYKYPQPAIDTIESTFKRELTRLKLNVVNGEVVQPKGTISSASAGDVAALNNLYKDLLTFKQSPTLANGIDLRKNLDAKVKFGKSARDVSNEVDPLSRSVRRVIAEESAKVVGNDAAAELAKYSDFMDAYGDLKSFTERAAGGEYLLRLVLSGRGGDARKLIQTVKEYTGIDLMNDATAMKVVTDVIGNDSTKNLFRQEVSKAGYDVATVVSGSPLGIAEVAYRRLVEYKIDAEEVLKKAAASGITPETLAKAGTAGTLGIIAATVAEDDSDAALGMMLIGMAALTPAAKIIQIDDFVKTQTKRLENMRGEGMSVNNPQYMKIEDSIAKLNKERAALLKAGD